jgi:hypothetical protein
MYIYHVYISLFYQTIVLYALDSNARDCSYRCLHSHAVLVLLMPLSTRKDVRHPYDYIPHACRCRRACETSSIDMQRQCKSAIVCGVGRYPFIHTSTPPLSPGHTVASCARRMCVLRSRICEHSCANVRACEYACVRLTAMCVAKRSCTHSTPSPCTR